MKHLAIIIPTFNRRQELFRLLESIYSQIQAWEHINIVIVVDGSVDGTVEMIDTHFPMVHTIESGGDLWYTKSMILGYEYCIQNLKANYILTLNDDVICSKDYFSELSNAVKSLPNNSIIGSACLTSDVNPITIFSGIKEIIWWRYKLIAYNQEETNCDYKISKDLPGRGILIPMEVVKKIGFYDPTFFQYASDSDFIYRSRKAGFKVFIAFKAILRTDIESTGNTSIYNKAVLSFLKSFFNPYSKTYLVNEYKLICRYGISWLWPITIIIKIGGHIRNYFRHNINL